MWSAVGSASGQGGNLNGDGDELRWIRESEVARAWRAIDRADRIVLEMFLATLLVLLLLSFAFGGGLTGSGQFGDTVGGAANLVTLFVVVMSFRWARGEVTRFRDQQRDVAHADTAREIWRRTYRFGSELVRCCQLVRRAASLTGGQSEWHRRSADYGEQFRDAWADFQLSYGNVGMEHLQSLWDVSLRFESIADTDRSQVQAGAVEGIEGDAEEAMRQIRRLLTPRANLTGTDDRGDELRTMIAELSPRRFPPPEDGAAPPPEPPASGPSRPPSAVAQAPTPAEVHSNLFAKLRDLEHALGDAEERTRSLARPGDLLPKLPNRRLGFWALAQLLARREVLSSEQVVSLSQLREIRNTIVHAREIHITRDEFERALDATNLALSFLAKVGR